MHSTHGKEMDLLRTTVKVPGKRPPRAVSACGPSASVNGLLKDGGSDGAGEGGGGRGRPGRGGAPRGPGPPFASPSPPARSRGVARGAQPPSGAGERRRGEGRAAAAALRLRVQRQAAR